MQQLAKADGQWRRQSDDVLPSTCPTLFYSGLLGLPRSHPSFISMSLIAPLPTLTQVCSITPFYRPILLISRTTMCRHDKRLLSG